MRSSSLACSVGLITCGCLLLACGSGDRSAEASAGGAGSAATGGAAGSAALGGSANGGAAGAPTSGGRSGEGGAGRGGRSGAGGALAGAGAGGRTSGGAGAGGNTSGGQGPGPSSCSEIETFEAGKSPARELHVATDGSDSGDGSAARPFATIERALQAAMPGTAVRVHPGTYPGDNYVEDLAGTQAAPIWLGGMPGAARPLIEGGSQALHVVKARFVIIHDLEFPGSPRTASMRMTAVITTTRKPRAR